MANPTPSKRPCSSGGHRGAEHDGARDVRELAKQSLLARLIQRYEPARARAHDVAVAQEEEQQEQHDRESDHANPAHRGKTSRPSVRGAAALPARGNHPGLDLCGGVSEVGLKPRVGAGHERNLLKIRDAVDVELRASCCSPCSRTDICETNSIDSARQRQQDGDGREHGQQAAAAPAVPCKRRAQPEVQRVQQER